MTTDHFKFTLKIIFTLFLYLSLSFPSSLIYFILAHLNVIDVLDIRKGERLSSVNRKFVWMSLVFFSPYLFPDLGVCVYWSIFGELTKFNGYIFEYIFTIQFEEAGP